MNSASLRWLNSCLLNWRGLRSGAIGLGLVLFLQPVAVPATAPVTGREVVDSYEPLDPQALFAAPRESSRELLIIPDSDPAPPVSRDFQAQDFPPASFPPGDFSGPDFVPEMAEDLPQNSDFPAGSFGPETGNSSRFRTHESDSDRIQIIDPLSDSQDKDKPRRDLSLLMTAPYTVYRSEQNMLSWIPASGEHLSWLDWQTDPYLALDAKHGLTGAMNVHWIGGPLDPDVPSRVYDFSLGCQVRDDFSDEFSFDAAISVGVFSDFEGSARDGVRFPGHAVGMLHVNRCADLVLGVDFLDRDDLHLLPVVGISLRNILSDRMRWDLVFPRPRIDYQLSRHRRIYLAGQLGGGTWDMEYPDESDDVLTYRDYRLLLGLESANRGGLLSSWELGYVFHRRLEFRQQTDPLDFGDAFVIQWVSRH